MRIFVFLPLIWLFACSSVFQKKIRVGIDRQWSPLDFKQQTAYVNGFVENLLLEMSQKTHVEFELIQASSDNLLEGMKRGKYEAILTSLPPYEYNKAHLCFSQNFLDIGPVLIVPKDSEAMALFELKGDLLGVLTDSPAALIAAKFPEIIIRRFPTIPDLLSALLEEQIQGALLDKISAYSYVQDLFASSLKIVSKPLNKEGLHLVGGFEEVELFDKALRSIKRKKKLSSLREKWELGP